MTLMWELLIATSVILMMSALENAPIIDTVRWVWNGAQGSPSGGITSTGTPQTNTNVNTNQTPPPGTGTFGTGLVPIQF